MRARGHTDADLAGAFHHAHQHDVHDADAADQRENRRHGAQEQGERILRFHGGLENRGHVADAEIFSPMPGFEQCFHSSLRRFDVRGVGHFYGNAAQIALAE